MATTKWDIATRVASRLDNLPSNLGSAVIVTFVEDSANNITNITGQSIDQTDIGSSFHGPLTDLATAYTVARKMMNEIDIDAQVGEIRATYGNLKSADAELLKFYVDKANMGLKGLGGTIRFVKTVPKV